ncbi:alpha/beta hydrolase [Janibacter sp. G368]|uniref:alpha/beta hydrolase n=1 Tax=Janibacter sp. G368 TaxID=3420441 RepID=UPI003CFD2B6E
MSHGADPDRLDEIARSLGDLSTQLTDVGTQGDAMIALLAANWCGGDVESFAEGWRTSGRGQLQSAADRLSGVSRDLVAQALAQRTASAEGGARPLSVSAPAVLAIPTGAGAGAGVADPAPAPAEADDPDDLLTDQRGRGGVMPVAWQNDPGGGGSDSDPNHPPPVGASARENSDWWNGLTPQQKQEVLAKHPEKIGNRDGIPYGVRDQANRAQLDRKRAWLVQQRDQNHPIYTNNGRIGGGDYDEYQAKINSIDAIKRTLADDPNHEKQLIVLDTSHDRTEAAIARGNLDTADHIAVMTPGYTTTVDGSMPGMDRESGDLKTRTEGVLAKNGQSDESVATVAWIGYQAPQHSTALVGDSVLSTSAAQRGADNLAGFGDGIRAVRGDEPHVTALGHSYGSTTTSYAVQQTDAFDDAVYFGSPGLNNGGVGNVGEGHAYVIEADGDKIADSAMFGMDPTLNKDLVHLHSREHTVGTPEGDRQYRGSSGHSEYYENGSMSQYNMAHVIAGHGDQTVRANNTDGLDSWPAPDVEDTATPDTERKRDKPVYSATSEAE